MGSANIILKKNPKIEFQLLESGFQLNDEQTEKNTGFYHYEDLRSVEINKIWFPRLANCLRFFTWMFNGVPLFPDAENYKKANVVIHFKKKNLGVWLTDTYMAHNAKLLKKSLDNKSYQRG